MVFFYSPVCVLIIGILASSVQADLIAYEPFDYSNAGEDLLEKEGGTGFFTEWIQYDGAPILENWKVVEDSLSFAGLETHGNSVTSDVLFGDSWVGLMREFGDEVPETTTQYLSFLMRPEGDVQQGAFGGAFGVVLAGTDGDGDLLVGMTDGPSDYMIETFFDTDTYFTDVSVESGVTSLLVIKAEFDEGVDTFTLYVDPTPGLPEPADGTVKDDLDVGSVIGIGIAAAGAVSVDEIRWGDTFADVTPGGLPGDFDGDGQLTAVDIDQLSVAVKGGLNPPEFDLNGDQLTNQSDRTVWVKELKNTWIGDANLDGEFNSGDLVEIFQAGEYEDGEPMNSGWATGDWDGDAEFGTGDLVLAFQDGGFEQGPRALNSVPEPTSAALIVTCGFISIASIRPRRQRCTQRPW